MERLAIAAVLVLLALIVAYVAQRRRGTAQGTAPNVTVPNATVPASVDFTALGIDAGPAIVVFTEETCRTCAAEVSAVRGAAGLAVTEVPFAEQREAHRRHNIDTVPTTVVANRRGQVVDGWIGRVDIGELANAMQLAGGRQGSDEGNNDSGAEG